MNHRRPKPFWAPVVDLDKPGQIRVLLEVLTRSIPHLSRRISPARGVKRPFRVRVFRGTTLVGAKPDLLLYATDEASAHRLFGATVKAERARR